MDGLTSPSESKFYGMPNGDFDMSVISPVESKLDGVTSPVKSKFDGFSYGKFVISVTSPVES